MIKKYRKKPVVIEAVHFCNNTADCIEFIGDKCFQSGNCIIIQTLEGEMVAGHGDYIIKGIQGEFYPCKPDIFEETYEEV